MYSTEYLNKREKLFNDKKYNKWELTKDRNI